ncbi:MAG TPA: hypothetical protein VH678_15950 [Xanthobacteraceae bacterium]|jgi:hypothetical protein
MDILAGDLKAIEDETRFVSFFGEFAKGVLQEARLFPKLSQPRVIEAHGAWCSDLKRVGDHEPQLGEGLDHFKRCGHLAFWVRRMSPVVEAVDLTQNIADAEGMALSDDEKAFRELLFGYCNEYLAFDLGFQFCRFYEVAKKGGSPRAESLILSDDYLKTTCHFLKYKNVSPHALFLIYKSLFLVP